MTKIIEINWQDVADGKGIEGDSGKFYKLESELNYARMRKAEELIIQLEFGLTSESLMKELSEVSKIWNKSGQFDAAIKLAKIQEHFYQITMRGDATMKLAALYLNSDDEDRTDASDAMIDRKINDWGRYSYASFFALSLSIVAGLKESLQDAALNGLVSLNIKERDQKQDANHTEA